MTIAMPIKMPIALLFFLCGQSRVEWFLLPQFLQAFSLVNNPFGCGQLLLE